MTWKQVLGLIAGALAILALIGIGLEPTVSLAIAVLLLAICEVAP